MHSNTAKRILIVTDLWHTHPNGVATVVDNLKRELEKRGHVVDVLEPSPFLTVPFPLYPEMRLPIFASGAVRRKIREGAYDHIHIETEAFLGIYARRACLSAGIPFTTSLHGQHHLYARNWLYGGKWLGSVFEKIAIRVIVWFHTPAVATLVSTEAMKKQLHEFGLSRVSIRPLGVSDTFFTRGTCPVTLDKPVFMYMGRVSSEKGIEEFLSAALPGMKLVIGDGPDKGKLSARFPEARFVGSQTGAALIAWCSCADVMVMPSRTETFGLAMVENLALGIPVAAHDATGPREIIENGVNGYLDEDIARAARRCLTLSTDDCRASVRKYTWSASADAFLSAVESARIPRR